MKYIAIVISLVFSSLWVTPPAQAAEQIVMVAGPEFWSVPRHGEQLLAEAPLKAAVLRLQAEPVTSLVLHHPDGEFGELWGLELQAWLVSLGVVSDRVVLRGGYGSDDGVAVILISPDAAGEEVKEPSVDENRSAEGEVADTPAPAEVEVEPQ